eukprot:31559-Pelagococcus_subviridis.AAC.7
MFRVTTPVRSTALVHDPKFRVLSGQYDPPTMTAAEPCPPGFQLVFCESVDHFSRWIRFASKIAK